ncbi:hypothetical protein DPMN_001794 [Dreissena polymorpha]|uniref:Uncharacterized protein n=1 Tax=Dreissena polymorpha TaxID=45954 RepID=A0A9D4MK11_DREPO|nr:hypothetical protein DPMN_001792 [Dreissena polymorpha]KAH3877913.1 hypothetical protein DPMN_001793 [Dreissena polymorpha]KAH3877914.1 hypothetical protein DPMN_001794 [Dreissena polymorpha]
MGGGPKREKWKECCAGHQSLAMRVLAAASMLVDVSQGSRKDFLKIIVRDENLTLLLLDCGP